MDDYDRIIAANNRATCLILVWCLAVPQVILLLANLCLLLLEGGR